MRIQQSKISGAWLLEGQRFFDSRGWFQELFTHSKVSAATGFNLDVQQINISYSRQNVVRGIHFSMAPAGQAKYVSVLNGTVEDYVVDVRTDSPTFGQWEKFELTSNTPSGVLISGGLGHAFRVMSTDALVCYGVSSEYNPVNEHALSPLCTTVNLGWNEKHIVLSEKDRDAPDLLSLRALGLLPTLPRG